MDRLFTGAPSLPLRRPGPPLKIPSDVSKIPLEDIKQATNYFAQENIIEKDYNMTVYKGELSGKKLAFVVANEESKMNISRVVTLSSLPKHQNLVPFIGCSDEDGKLIFVFEHPTRGSLDKYVSSTAHLTWLMRVKICLDIASALHYLSENHSEMRIEDLNNASICLDENWQAKIQLIKPTKLIGEPPGRAPSFSATVRAGSSYSNPVTIAATKIYSFGVILFELLCARPAVTYDEEQGEQFLRKLACSHYEKGTLTEIIDPVLRVQMNQDSFTVFSELAYRCLNEDQYRLPNISEVVEELQKVLKLQEGFETSELQQSSTFEIKKTFDLKSESVKSIDLHPIEPWVLIGLCSGNVNIWNYRSQVTEKSFEIAKSPIRAAKFIANKEWFVCGADDGFIRVYNYNNMECVVELKAHTDFVRSFTVHPSLPYVLSASDDKTIKLWDWENGWKCTKTFEGHEHYVMQVAFNPRDTNAFASVSLDCTIKFWDLGFLVPRLSINAHKRGLNNVEFCSIEEKLYFITMSDDYTAKVWDYDTMTCLQTLEGHTNNVTSIQYVKSDVSFIITGSEDKTVCIWNATTHKLDHVFTSELGRVWAIVFIKDLSEIILGCDEGILVSQVTATHL